MKIVEMLQQKLKNILDKVMSPKQVPKKLWNNENNYFISELQKNYNSWRMYWTKNTLCQKRKWKLEKYLFQEDYDTSANNLH